MSSPTLSSTPTNPTTIAREIGGVHFRLSPDGLEIIGLAAGRLTLDLSEALALSDFARTAGVRQLVNRAWLAQQHAAALAE